MGGGKSRPPKAAGEPVEVMNNDNNLRQRKFYCHYY